jgi:hypothetical protein
MVSFDTVVEDNAGMAETIRRTAGQAVLLRVYQQTGVTEELTPEGDGTWLEVTYLGP